MWRRVQRHFKGGTTRRTSKKHSVSYRPTVSYTTSEQDVGVPTCPEEQVRSACSHGNVRGVLRERHVNLFSPECKTQTAPDLITADSWAYKPTVTTRIALWAVHPFLSSQTETVRGQSPATTHCPAPLNHFLFLCRKHPTLTETVLNRPSGVQSVHTSARFSPQTSAGERPQRWELLSPRWRLTMHPCRSIRPVCIQRADRWQVQNQPRDQG